MNSFVLPPTRRSAVCEGSEPRFISMTGWIPAIGVREVKLLFQVTTRTGGFEAAPALQVAKTNVDDPDPFRPLSSGYSNDESRHCTGIIDVSAAPFGVSDAFFVRFGMTVRGTGKTLDSGELSMTVSART